MSTELEITLAAAKSGDVIAQNTLGIMYLNADGAAQNYAEALRWFKLSAEQGDAVGQSYLGNMYYNGLGVEPNYTEALKWYKLSAEQVNILGKNNLAPINNKSHVVERGYIESLLDRATSSGLRGAKHGAIRGTANIVECALQTRGLPSRTASGIQQAVYYGSYFLWRYHDYIMQENSIDANGITNINALFKAAADTGSILFLNNALSWCSKKLKQLEEQANYDGQTNISAILKWFSGVSEYAVYAYDSVHIGVVETAASIVAGRVAQFGVEQSGRYLIGNLYRATIATKVDDENIELLAGSSNRFKSYL